jgi:hypothetical protein
MSTNDEVYEQTDFDLVRQGRENIEFDVGGTELLAFE